MGRKRCRDCRNFIRIKEYGKIRPRGFCILGEGDGSFSLYIDSSVVYKCPSYIENGNVHITKLEDKLWDKSNAVMYKYEDEIFAKKRGLKGLASQMFEVREKAHKEFLENNIKELGELEKLCKFTKVQHQEIIDKFVGEMRGIVGGLL